MIRKFYKTLDPVPQDIEAYSQFLCHTLELSDLHIFGGYFRDYFLSKDYYDIDTVCYVPAAKIWQPLLKKLEKIPKTRAKSFFYNVYYSEDVKDALLDLDQRIELISIANIESSYRLKLGIHNVYKPYQVVDINLYKDQNFDFKTIVYSATINSFMLNYKTKAIYANPKAWNDLQKNEYCMMKHRNPLRFLNAFVHCIKLQNKHKHLTLKSRGYFYERYFVKLWNLISRFTNLHKNIVMKLSEQRLIKNNLS